MKIVILALIIIIGQAAMAQSCVFVFLNKKEDKKELSKEEVDKLMEGHMANIDRLAKEGKLVAAGPFDGGGGIFIFGAASVAQVKEWVATDPAVKAERWNLEFFPYTPVVGSVCTLEPPYNIISYHFVRYRVQLDKANASTAADALEGHYLYLKGLSEKDNLITVASFGNAEGGIMVTSGDWNEDRIANDPAVRAGVLSTELKSLYIAKGAFCER